MRYVFFGSPRFAEIVLEKLIASNMPPAALVANPDRPAGRKKTVSPPPTKRLASAKNAEGGAPIVIFQPEKLDENFIRTVRAIDPDLFVVAAYARIIPAAVLAIPRKGTIGVHPSLLPKYRGASPIQSAILAGEFETGTTLYLMDEKMDHGPIISQETVALDALRTDYPALERTLADLGAKLLIKALPHAADGNAEATPQSESSATFTKKFVSEDAFVDPSDLSMAENGASEIAEVLIRKINAFTPEPGAWTTKDGRRMKLVNARISDGKLKLLAVQYEGERVRTL